ncbi:MAG: uridine kinase [Candidatus Cloacimonetes bacterium]|nr:uridine kinase [Candidatus Cloacimonadota bacterium]
MKTPLLIGIAGGTGSGKTTITEKIIEKFPDQITIINQDSYYRAFNDLPLKAREKINFDHPDSFDWLLLFKHLENLKNNVPIESPIYDFKKHCRSSATIMKKPAPIIIIEGILIFDNPQLRELMDIKIFVDTDSDIRILRRIERDIEERGRSLPSIIAQYYETVRPMNIEFVEPTKRYANVIIPEGGYNLIGIDMIIAKIKSCL